MRRLPRDPPPYGSPDQLAAYPSFDDAQCDGHVDAWTQRVPYASRFAYFDGAFYGLWHATDSLRSNSIPSGTRRPDLELVGFDQGTHGLSVPDDDTVVVLSSHLRNEGLYVFDADSGENTDVIEDVGGSGLVCVVE